VESIEQELMQNSAIRVPSTQEQIAIADFLDHKTSEIDTLTARKHRIIELLDEARQALISRAVAYGVRPNARTKESGVDWLGRVPADWQITRLKFALASIEQGWSPQCDSRAAEPGEWGVLKVGCVNGGAFAATENKALPTALDSDVDSRLEIKPGDLLISRANTRELVGSTALVASTRPRLLLCDKLFRVKVGHSLQPQYATLLLQSRNARNQIEIETNGTSGSMQNIGQDTIRNLVFALPPLEEQSQICAWAQERQELTGVAP
jgi:type I restriction enzyme S subunit